MKNICYIPLDNRPVVYKRVILCGRSAGLNIITPPEDIIMTALDGQPLSSSGYLHGDIFRLMNWFNNLNHDNIDAYIICSDQILFGGLVNSRIENQLSLEKKKSIIDSYMNKTQDKPVILIDSLVRLASTASYQNYNLNEYNNTRNYCMAERKQDIALTLDGINSNYEINSDGLLIDYNKYGLTEQIKNDILKVRKNKLMINDYYLSSVVNKYSNVFYMLGIDDSNPSITIQTNEIRYLKTKMKSDNCLIFTGIDELPLIGIARLSMLFNQYNNVTLNITLFGGKEDSPGDAFDTGTINESINSHLLALNVKKAYSADIEVVGLTYNKETFNDDVKDIGCYVDSLIKENKKVILLDLTGSINNGFLAKEVLKYNYMTKLLAYSNWNTIANVIGLGLSQGISRYCYIMNHDYDNNSTKAYIELLIFSYIKDMIYKCYVQYEMKEYVNKINNDFQAFINFYKYYLNNEKLYLETLYNLMNTNENINVNTIIEKIILNEIDGYIVKKVVVNDYSFPWYRTFEIDFDVNCEIEEKSKDNV